MIGVIGGMGPLATVDFFRKLIDETPALRDEDHLPVLIHSVPRLPGRPEAILAGAPSPLPELRAARDRLLRAGAVALAMPCNTAHFWFDDLAAGCPVPLLHIVEAVGADLARCASAGSVLGILATRATLACRVYDARMQARGYTLRPPDDALWERAVGPAIAAVKAGDEQRGGRLLEAAVRDLLDGGATAVVLACTELPIALASIGSPLLAHCVDSNRSLARACVRWWRSSRPTAHV